MSLVEKLCKAKLEFSGIQKDGAANLGNRSYKYMTLDAIVSAISQPLARHGIHFSHTFALKEPFLEVTCTLTDGTEIMTNMIPMPMPVGGHNPAQAMGSVITYGKRYSLAALLGLAADDDDDAQQAKTEKPVPVRSNVAEVLDKSHQQRLAWLDKQFKLYSLLEQDKRRIIAESLGKNAEQLMSEIKACVVS